MKLINISMLLASLFVASFANAASYPFPNGKSLQCQAKSLINKIEPMMDIVSLVTIQDRSGNLKVVGLKGYVEADGTSAIFGMWAEGASDQDGKNAEFRLFHQDPKTLRLVESAILTISNGAGTLKSYTPGLLSLALKECEVR